MHKREPKFNIPMFAALVLLLLTMVSMHLTSGLYARYTASSGGSASARVAKFDVVHNLAPVTDDPGHYTLTVTNKSEVTVQFKLDVVYDAPMSVSIKDTAEPTKNGNTYTFTDENWTLVPNTGEKVLDLTFNMTDWTQITKDANGKSAEKSYHFDVLITAEQVD